LPFDNAPVLVYYVNSLGDPDHRERNRQLSWQNNLKFSNLLLSLAIILEKKSNPFSHGNPLSLEPIVTDSLALALKVLNWP